ncbi:MAG TPA: ABC transporter permease, partial [Candidatus Dormibacteraeota bacterium]|nr:ABC transporter permease [Candidatus Dormibacteraeota bacterium]
MSLTATAHLIRLILRRDRLRISIWIAAIALLVFFTAVGVKSLFPTQASIDQAAAATEHNAGAIAFNGPAQGLDTLGGQIAFQVGAFGMIAVALMSFFMIGRLTRGDEEAGRLELVRSLPVGIHAPAFAALITVVGMNVAVGVLSSAALLAEGLPAVGSLALGASYTVVGVFFTGAALLAAQVTENTRVVYGSSGALLGLAYLMRIVGDIGDGRLSWFSPIGLAQKARPYAGERWWPLLLLFVPAAVLIAVASRLAVRRDYGSGLVAPRPGRTDAAPSLGHPLGLAMRLQRGSLIGWGAGVLVTGIAYGWIAPTIDSFVAGNKALAQMMASAGSGSLTDTYFATAFRVLALIASGFAIQSALRLRGEESALRAESVLATPVSRWRWGSSHLVIALAGSVGLLAVAGLATGISYGLAGGPWSSVPRLLGAALVYAPAIWLMT